MSAKSSRQETSNVLSHWYAFVEGIHFSAQDFYAAVENELTARKLPRLSVTRVDFHEESLVSDKRVYLRLARERFAFDVCAAPFGTGYFFSARLIEKPRSWSQLVVILILAGVVFGVCVSFAKNPLWAWIWFLGISLGIIWAIRFSREFSASPSPNYDGAFNAPSAPAGKNDATAPLQETECDKEHVIRVVTSAREPRRFQAATPQSAEGATRMPTDGGSDFDGWLLNTAVIGNLYERARTDTYYRYDTRLLFLGVVTNIVKKQVDHLISEKGVKFTGVYEYSPLIGDLYKPVVRKLEREESERPVNAVG